MHGFRPKWLYKRLYRLTMAITLLTRLRVLLGVAVGIRISRQRIVRPRVHAHLVLSYDDRPARARLRSIKSMSRTTTRETSPIRCSLDPRASTGRRADRRAAPRTLRGLSFSPVFGTWHPAAGCGQRRRAG